MLAILTTPGSSLLLGLLAFGIVLLVTRRRAATATSPSTRLAVLGPLAVLIVYAISEATPYLATLVRYVAPAFSPLFDVPPELRWWAFLPVPVAAVVVVAVMFAALTARVTVPEVPVTPVIRRGWLSFTERRDLVFAITTLSLLLVTILVAGSASATGFDGWLTGIEFRMGEALMGYSTFFGWGYSLPLLAAMIVLSLLVALALRVNAARPFARPETVEFESAERSDRAELLARLLTCAALLTLGAAWVLIGDAGGSSVGYSVSGEPPVIATTGWSSATLAFTVLGSAMQVTAVALLLLTVRAHSRKRATPALAAPITAAVAR